MSNYYIEYNVKDSLDGEITIIEAESEREAMDVVDGWYPDQDVEFIQVSLHTTGECAS